jgi:hypothetical protein
VELIPERGVTIETTGGLVQGAWGNGKSDFGLLTIIGKEELPEVTPTDIDVSMRGGIVMGGYCQSEDVIRMAQDLTLRGLILVSASAALAPVMQRASIPIMLLEGFGKRNLHPAAQKLLASADRRDVALLAEIWDRHQGVRPELIIPAPATSYITPPPEMVNLTPGVLVRILRAPAAGASGTLSALKGSYTFPGGLRARAAEVKLENGSVVIVPVANLEVIQ